MSGDEELGPLKPVELLQTMVALQDTVSRDICKRFYVLADPKTAGGRVSRYILEKEAFTIEILYKELKIPRRTLYRVVDELVDWCVVYKTYRVDTGKAGAKSRMFVLAGVHPFNITRAHRLHKSLKAPQEDRADTPLKQLVIPIVEEMIEDRDVLIRTGEHNFINLKKLRHRFFKLHEYIPDNLPRVAQKVIEEYGFKMMQED